VPILAIHPGEHLAEELTDLGMSAAELARQLNVPTNRVTEILNARRAITGDTALRLAHFFGTTPNFGSTCKVCMSYVSRRRKWESPSADSRR
jgi:antitoxin HigA-1